jgi:transcriptional regulator with XRE-family HTH domain
MNDPLAIGKQIERLRKAKQISQRELARLSGLGSASISHYESGFRSPGYKAMLAISAALGCKINDLDPDCPVTTYAPAQEENPAEVAEVIEAWPRLTSEEKIQIYRLALRAASRASHGLPPPPGIPHINGGKIPPLGGKFAQQQEKPNEAE